MKESAKRAIAILLILCISIGIGFAVDRIWLLIEKHTHPNDYRELIDQYAAEYNVPPDLVAAIIKVESGFDPDAESQAGARGLMQIMPEPTFEWLTGEEHLCEFLPKAALYDPEVNIRYGTYYLSYLQKKFSNWNTTVAAYNGGEGRVSEWLNNPDYSDGNGNLTYIPLEETREYVVKVNAALDTYQKLYKNSSSKGD